MKKQTFIHIFSLSLKLKQERLSFFANFAPILNEFLTINLQGYEIFNNNRFDVLFGRFQFIGARQPC